MKPPRTNIHPLLGALAPSLVHQEKSELLYYPTNEQVVNPSQLGPLPDPISLTILFLLKKLLRTNIHPPPRALELFPVHQENSESLYSPTNEQTDNLLTKPSQTPKRDPTSLNPLL